VFFIVPPEFGFGLNVGLVNVNVLLEVKSAALLSFEDVIDKLSYKARILGAKLSWRQQPKDSKQVDHCQSRLL
jgi:hypothetical protein